MNELDIITDIVFNKVNNASDSSTIPNYTGQYASGGKFSIHDIFKGGKVTGYKPMEEPITDAYCKTTYQHQNDPPLMTDTHTNIPKSEHQSTDR